MNQKKLLVERIDNHIVLTLNRAEKRNALDDELVSDLEDFFSQPVEDCQCIIIQGSGEHFSAGLDLFELMEKRSSDNGTGFLT